ncbi:MAG: phosphoglycerate mutase, partial [SAR324 cluster bacterium]|nr:phosphoglycerate mutase [SAR324 cluster bacterium]
KIKAIEAIDGQIVGPLLDGLAALGPFKILITSDHATPISLRTHCADPVPFAMAGAGQLDSGGGTLKYGERTALASGVVISDGHSIIERLLAWPE